MPEPSPCLLGLLGVGFFLPSLEVISDEGNDFQCEPRFSGLAFSLVVEITRPRLMNGERRGATSGENEKRLDLNGHGSVNAEDLAQWPSTAASRNGFGEAYLLGDANLDGTVNSKDLNQTALSWSHDGPRWSAGDFTADGYVDAAGLDWLALNRQASVSSDASP